MPKVSKIEKLYDGAHAIVAAPGPSLTQEVVETIREVKDKYAIIGVGDAYRRIDFLDEHYACDARWWKVHGKDVNDKFPGLRSWCHDEEGMQYGAYKIEGRHKNGFSLNPEFIHFGSNSGYQTLNLCWLWGIRKIILVGFNMQKVGGHTHFFKDRHPTLSISSPYPSFVKKYLTIQSDIRNTIINCTPNSALTAFHKAGLKETLNV